MVPDNNNVNTTPKYFRYLALFISFALCLYAGKLLQAYEMRGHLNFYFSIRFFFIFWVAISIVIGFFGEAKKIGGMKAFLISLFNPALGLIMVMASEPGYKPSVKEREIRRTEKKIQVAPGKSVFRNTAYTLNN